MGVVFYNGGFITERDVFISSNSRAFNYGDGFFETVKIINSKLVNFPYHFERIKLALSVLKLYDNYTLQFFQEKLFHLVEVNKIVNGSIKIHISRSGAGRYLPKSDHVDLFIITSNGSAYKKNDPISLCFYDKECKAIGGLSNIKSVNSLVSVLASVYANENNFDTAILLNTLGNIIEVANANIFIVKDDTIYTPSLFEGCVDGTMRKWVSNEIDVCEKAILKNEILDADEVFITNAINGLTPIHTIEKTSFTSFNTASSLQQKLINSSLDL
jgi:branched-chain amino acid aminotransferase